MEVRRTLEKPKETGDFTASRLKVGYVLTLTDTDDNKATLKVMKITQNEVVFEQTSSLSTKYTVILNRNGDELRDEKGRIVTAWGQLIQYNLEGKEI